MMDHTVEGMKDQMASTPQAEVNAVVQDGLEMAKGGQGKRLLEAKEADDFNELGNKRGKKVEVAVDDAGVEVVNDGTPKKQRKDLDAAAIKAKIRNYTKHSTPKVK